MNKSRFENASDGVFAIAITLLVLGLAVPVIRAADDAALSAALMHLWPNFLAYVLSFAVIGIMWNNHHMLFRTVQRIDRTTFFLNLLLLGVTAFIPFATSVLGTYPSLKTATVTYGLTLDAAAITYNAILHYLIKSGAFYRSINDETLRQTVVAYRVGLITYVAATAIGFISPRISFALYGAIALYYLFPRGLDTDAVAEETGNP
jgi:uncharacterized membrane protein